MIIVNPETDKMIDGYFDGLPQLDSVKLLHPSVVSAVIKECIHKPMGIVPDSVYKLFPDLIFD